MFLDYWAYLWCFYRLIIVLNEFIKHNNNFKEHFCPLPYIYISNSIQVMANGSLKCYIQK